MQLDSTKFKIFLKNIFKYLLQRRMKKKEIKIKDRKETFDKEWNRE